MNRSMAPVGRLLLGGLLGGVLAGCVNLPDSSSVNTGEGAGVPVGQGQVRFSPPGPQPDASREEVIQGYLTAMLAYPSDPVVVRQFMTRPAALAWRPDEQIQVYEEPEILDRRDGVHITGKLLGSVDDRGSWTSATGVAPEMDKRVPLVKDDGEWRIAHAVAGTLMNTEHFAAYYHQFSLYFYDPGLGLIAPDPVYLETGAPGATATALVHNLLLGPTTDMALVARNVALPGTHLTSRVTVSAGGFATVPLSSDVLSLDSTQLPAFAKQLAWTLRQERVGVKTMSIRVNGRAVPVRGGPIFSVGAFHDPTLSAASRQLYALNSRGRLLRVSAGGTSQAVTGPIADRELVARSAAINPSNICAALVSKDGTTVVSGALTIGSSDTSCRTVRHDGTNLLRPSWDANGLLWLVDMEDGQATLYVANGSTKTVVPAANLAGLDVRAFAVSRDGMRLAAVINHGATSRLAVFLINRPAGAELTDVSLVGFKTIVNADFPLSNIHGLTWVNGTTLAVLARNGTSEAQPYQVSIDGSRVTPIAGSLSNQSGTAAVRPVSIAAGPSPGILVVGASDGSLYDRSGKRWTLLTSLSLTAPAYPS